MFQRRMCDAFSDNRIEIVAIGTKSRVKDAADFCDGRGLDSCLITSNYFEAMNLGDFCYLSATNETNRNTALMCLANNKPVLVEKTFCVSDQEWRYIESNPAIFECFQFHFSENLKMLCEFVDMCFCSGRKVVIEGRFSIPPLNEENFRYDGPSGGGAYRDLGVYGFSLLHKLAGLESLRIADVVKRRIVERNSFSIDLGGDVVYEDDSLNFVFTYDFDAAYQNFVIARCGDDFIKLNRFFTSPAGTPVEVISNKIVCGRDVKYNYQDREMVKAALEILSNPELAKSYCALLREFHEYYDENNPAH